MSAVRSLRIASIALGLLALPACGDIEAEAPAVASQGFDQLSGGPGVSIYDFIVRGDRVGSVMVTDGASGAGYGDQYEYWLWDDRTVDKLRDGDIRDLAIHVAHQEPTWTDEAAEIFEDETSGWIAYAVPRHFELQIEPREAKEDKKKERFVYQLDAPAWGGMEGNISYYVEIDFEEHEDIPTMEWLVDADDLKTYYHSEMNDEDALEDDWTPPESASDNINRWEVRLTQDAKLEKVKDAWAYELTTLYPAH